LVTKHELDYVFKFFKKKDEKNLVCIENSFNPTNTSHVGYSPCLISKCSLYGQLLVKLQVVDAM